MRKIHHWFCVLCVLLTAMPAFADTDDLTTIVLNSGQEMTGTLRSETTIDVELELSTGVVVTIARAAIKEIHKKTAKATAPNEEPDPSASRYFFSPSAFMLPAGQTNFTQLELVYSQISFGVSDNVSLQAGTIIPLWFVPGTSANFQAAAKVGTAVTPDFHIAGGVFAAMFSYSSNAGGLILPFGTMTWGTMSSNVSLNVSPAFVFGNDQVSPLNTVLVSVAGKLRINPGMSLLTENYLFFRQDSAATRFVGSGGVRFHGKNLSADVGLFVFQGSEFPLPWVNFSYTF